MTLVPQPHPQAREVEATERPRWSDLLRPVTDLSADAEYKGEDGGLYGGGSNVPPASHLHAAFEAAAHIRPIDGDGRAGPAGRIGLLAVGFSNAWHQFREFLRLAKQDPAVSPAIVGVNCAQDHLGVIDWAAALVPSPSGLWDVVERRLCQRGVARAQVQAAWVKVAAREPALLGGFPEHAIRTKQALVAVLTELKARFPNLRIAYLSSRAYAGYATTGLNPEPWAYEGAFTIRWVIRDQIEGCTTLNHDAACGPVRVPLLLWGPYLWAAGATGRAPDGLVWRREDFSPDGAHPSSNGRRKVAELLLAFMKTDPTARPWFLK